MSSGESRVDAGDSHDPPGGQGPHTADMGQQHSIAARWDTAEMTGRPPGLLGPVLALADDTGAWPGQDPAVAAEGGPPARRPPPPSPRVALATSHDPPTGRGG